MRPSCVGQSMNPVSDLSVWTGSFWGSVYGPGTIRFQDGFLEDDSYSGIEQSC